MKHMREQDGGKKDRKKSTQNRLAHVQTLTSGKEGEINILDRGKRMDARRRDEMTREPPG